MSRRDQEPPDEVAAVLAWLERKSLPTSALADRMQVRAALDALTKKLDGTTAAASTIRRKRAIFHNALGYAVDAGRLTDNPLPQVQWKSPEQVAEELDPASVPDPRQALALLDAVRTQSPAGGAWSRSSAACTTRRHGRRKSSAYACRTATCLAEGGALYGSGRRARAPGRPGRTVGRPTTGEGSSTGPGRPSAPCQFRPT